MEMLNSLIQIISVDFDTNNNSTPTELSLNNGENDKKIETLSDQELNRIVIELLNSFKEWKLSIEFIESQCSLHDYKDVKANGFRSIFKINRLAIERVNRKLSAKELTIKHLTKSLSLAILMTKINKKIKKFYEKDQEWRANLTNNNQSIDLNDNQQSKSESFTSNNLFCSKVSVEFFEFYDELEQDLVEYFRFHPFFYLRKDLRKMAKALVTFLSASSSLPRSLIFNHKKRSKVIAKSLNNPTLSFPFSILDQLDCRTYNDVLIPLKFLFSNLSTNTVYLPRQNKFLLNDLNTSLETKKFIEINYDWSYDRTKLKASKNDKIRVRIIKNKSTTKFKSVMFHLHGGAFVFHSPECHEIYLREFAKCLPDVVIMSVAYRTAVEYPKNIQDVLDAYLWLISGLDEVEEVIGFKPEKIMFCGDSAG